MPTSDICQISQTTIDLEHPEVSAPTDNPLMFADDGINQPVVSTTMDFEQSNFDQYIGPDLTQCLVNPNHTVFTNARCVKVILLKILKELETLV